MNPLAMAPWMFLFGLPISCILVWGAAPETPHETLHDTTQGCFFQGAPQTLQENQEKVRMTVPGTTCLHGNCRERGTAEKNSIVVG